MNEKNCQNCQYWENIEQITGGHCRRYAPMPSKKDAIGSARWPTTDPNDWCGEFNAIKGDYAVPHEVA